MGEKMEELAVALCKLTDNEKLEWIPTDNHGFLLGTSYGCVVSHEEGISLRDIAGEKVGSKHSSAVSRALFQKLKAKAKSSDELAAKILSTLT